MRARGRKLHDDLLEVYGAMYLDLKARVEGGEHVPDCLAKTLIETREKENLDWEDTCMLAAVFTLGGVHSVCLSPSRLNIVTQLRTDFWDHPVVPRAYPVSPRNSSPCPRGARPSYWAGPLAYC